MSPAAYFLSGAVRAYELTIRPVIGAHCRFYPSCSAYAREAICIHGAAHGSVLAGKRILRCHPWHEGGFDPVPQPLNCSEA
jgi:putative membrane protein insertion efficiency factor